MGKMTESQYRQTKEWVKKFNRAIVTLSGKPPEGIDPIIYQAQIDGLRSQRDELRAKVNEYERQCKS